MENINKKIQSISPYKPGKPVEELAREMGHSDVIKLASNENPLGFSSKVSELLFAGKAELNRYPDGSGHQLKKVLAKKLGVEPDQLTLGNGSNDVLDLITRVVMEPGFEAIIPEHSFVVYRLSVTCANGEIVVAPAASGFGADLEAVRDRISSKTRLIFIANPNNPTGTWVGLGEIEKLLLAVPKSVWVVIDEAYFEYLDHPQYGSALCLMERFENLIITRTFSKIYGLASLRLGYGITSSKFADLLNRARQPFNVGGLTLAAGEAALSDDEFVIESRQENEKGLRQLEKGLDELGLPWIPSGGNFLAVDCDRDGQELFRELLKEGVIVRAIGEYGMPNHIRVSVGLPEENIRFLNSLAKVLGA